MCANELGRLLPKSARRIFRLAFSWPYISLFFLSTALFSGYIVVLCIVPRLTTVAGWLQSLTAGMLGSYLAAVLIGGVLDLQKEREEQHVRRVSVVQELDRLLNDHLVLLANWYAISTDSLPSDKPLENILKNDFSEETRKLDFSIECLISTSDTYENWLEYSAREFRMLREGLDKTIADYSFYLEPETVEKLQSLRNSVLLALFIDDFRYGSVEPPATYLDNDSYEDIAESHIDGLLSVIYFVEEQSKEQIHHLRSEELIDEFMLAEVGSAQPSADRVNHTNNYRGIY